MWEFSPIDHTLSLCALIRNNPPRKIFPYRFIGRNLVARRRHVPPPAVTQDRSRPTMQPKILHQSTASFSTLTAGSTVPPALASRPSPNQTPFGLVPVSTLPLEEDVESGRQALTPNA
jgi:hypothetical protein